MNFSESYLTEQFEKAYKSGIAAKERGDYSVAREQFSKAATLMRELADSGDSKLCSERKKTAERLENIVIAMARNTNIKKVRPESHATVANTSSELLEEQIPDFVNFYPAESIDSGFDSVVGAEEAKDKIRKYVINPRLYPNAYQYSFLSNMGILLVGPPGTGKTTFAKAVAYEVQQPFVVVNSSSLVNCYIGETGKNIDKLFAFLRRYAEKNICGITIFFDEFDEIAKRRGGEDKVSEAAVPALLRNLDGMINNEQFLILASTNLEREAFDPGIWERFRQRIVIPLPDEISRRKLFELKLKEIEPEFLSQLNLNEAATQTDGMSGRDIAFICDDLKYRISEIKAGIAAEGNIGEYLLRLIAQRAVI